MSGPVIGGPTVVLDSPHPHRLARFYCGLMGWQISTDEPDWVMIGPAGQSPQMSFQREPLYRRPSWPSSTDEQQMMMHLDIQVSDLDAARAHADSLGGTAADWQPQEHVLVYADPDGHILCLYVE